MQILGVAFFFCHNISPQNPRKKKKKRYSGKYSKYSNLNIDLFKCKESSDAFASCHMFHGFVALWFLSCCQMCSFFSELARSSNHRHASIDRVRTATMLFGLLSCSCHTLCSLVSSVESCRTLTGLCSCLACACYVCVFGQCDARGRWCKRLLVAHETVGCDTTVPCTARC